MQNDFSIGPSQTLAPIKLRIALETVGFLKALKELDKTSGWLYCGVQTMLRNGFIKKVSQGGYEMTPDGKALLMKAEMTVASYNEELRMNSFYF